MGADYIKNFIGGQTHRLGNRVVETDELWSALDDWGSEDFTAIDAAIWHNSKAED